MNLCLILKYRHQTQTHNKFDLSWQFVFRNAPKKVLVSLKGIITFLQFSSLKRTIFNPFGVNLVRIVSQILDTRYNQHHLMIDYTYYRTLSITC